MFLPLSSLSLYLSMKFVMTYKIGAPTEALTTPHTCKGFSPVWTRLWWSCEPTEDFYPHVTSVGLLSSVDTLMKLKTWGLTEVLPTLPTLIWFLSCVDPLMHVEVQAPLEALPTLLTFVWLLSSVDFLVGLKVWTPTEALACHIWMAFLHCGLSDGSEDERPD